jgi:hypothetical protein
LIFVLSVGSSVAFVLSGRPGWPVVRFEDRLEAGEGSASDEPE